MQISTACVPKYYGGNGLSLEKSLHTLTQSFAITQRRAVEQAKRYELVSPLVLYDCIKLYSLLSLSLQPRLRLRDGRRVKRVYLLVRRDGIRTRKWCTKGLREEEVEEDPLWAEHMFVPWICKVCSQTRRTWFYQRVNWSSGKFRCRKIRRDMN